MEFLHPAALWGLLLVGVPVIIHLITRRRALRKPFAAMQFVLLSYQKVRRKLHLKRILILLARALAVAALAMMITRPTVPARSGSMNMGAASRSIVILIDNTMSMSQGKDGSTPFDRARKIARSVLESLGQGQEAAVMAVDGDMIERPEGAMLRADPGPLVKALDSIRISMTYRSVLPALNAAAELAMQGRYPSRQVLFITDLQKADWPREDAVPKGGADILVLDVGPQESLPNAAITDIRIRPAAGEARFEASVDVTAYSKSPMAGREVVIRVEDEDRARGFIDLPASGTMHRDMSFASAGKGILKGTARLSPDSLLADNVRYFTARAGGRIQALVVDGDPKPERFGAESYFLMNALNPRLEARSRVDPTLTTVTEFENLPLKGYDVIILANVGSLRGKSVAQLKDFVKNGGAAIFALGDQVEPRVFQSTFDDLVPAPLFILKEPTDPEGIRLDPIRDQHPATAMFRTPAGGDLSLPRFHKYYLIDTATAPQGLRSVLSYSDGAPAIVERPYGKGRVAMFTSTLDRDWNDLCIYPTYLPLLQQLSLYLTGGLFNPEGAAIVAGSRVRFGCDMASVTALLVAPDNSRREINLIASGNEKSGEAPLDRGTGFYSIYCQAPGHTGITLDREPDRLLAVNVDTRESDLERWNREDLEKYLRDATKSRVTVATDLTALASGGGFAAGRNEIWKTLLALVVGLLLIEGLLTRNG